MTSPGAAPRAAAAASAFSIAMTVCRYVSPGWRTPSGPIGAVPLTATWAPARTAREYEARLSNTVPSLWVLRASLTTPPGSHRVGVSSCWARDPGLYACAVTEMRLYDLRVTVERIEGRSVCGLEVGDWFEVTESSRVRIPEGRHFCLFALQSVIPLLPAKMRRLPDEDWLEQDNLVCCPDPDERVVMRIERLPERSLVTEELT
jgi:uncharacterized repeat protein (TIGR04076 family)